MLALVLRYSTWLASAVVALGVTRVLLDAGDGATASAGTHVITLGIALFILIPVSRVILMAVVFAFEREYLLVGVAALVLSIIGLGLLLGLRGSARTPAPRAGSHRAAPQGAAVLSFVVR